ncbi:MAG: ATP-binding protein [Planctomycetota bacterium]|nr:ATP-binding protein [Planctomycetota bacterium]
MAEPRELNPQVPYQPPVYAELAARIAEPRRRIQVLLGPRQTGKTTGVRRVLEGFDGATHFADADETAAPPTHWIEFHWEAARRLARGRRTVLALDEIQKIPDWSRVVKGLWDRDTADGLDLVVVLLGSSTLLLHEGLTESLAGRFEVLRARHWNFEEMRTAFGFDLDAYVFHGGYPGAAEYVGDLARWRAFVRDALIETTISRDILVMARVEKPALLRALFQLACAYAGRVLSYTKMLGQLTDAGNTTTLAHYLTLLERAGLVVGLQKYSGEVVRRRGSSPKLQPLNTALVSALAGYTLEETLADPERWGRLVETTVGAHLVNTALGTAVEVWWWRDGNDEVDFVLTRGPHRTAIEVKSGKKGARWDVLSEFEARFGPCRKLVVGTGGIPLADFLAKPASEWVA